MEDGDTDISVEEMLLRESKVKLILESYNDLFSDFDPRPSHVRALSEDFLREAKNAVRAKASGDIELSFLIPKKLRNLHEEGIIKNRLHEHFRKHNHLLHSEMKEKRRKGFRLLLLGALLGIAATYVSLLQTHELIKNAIVIILEPSSWFTIWTGFELLFMPSQIFKLEHEFYERMSHCEISFQEY